MKSFKTIKSINSRNFNNISKLYKVASKEFGFFSKIKRHVDNLVEPGPKETSSALQDTNLALYTNMRQFQAFLTKNAYDMAVNNEYDLWPHTNFGTIDNPSLIFCASATWRLVCCVGPGSEEESSMHEKMYMIIREGPIHRCIMCGQCFKLVNLKDDLYDPLNSYYSSVFTEVSPKIVSEPELMPWMNMPFVSHDINMNNYNIRKENRNYVMVNNDEADHIMVDPAYRMQKYKEYEDYMLKFNLVHDEVSKQYQYIKQSDRDKVAIPRDVYETWYQVEKAIQKFDRVFNRYEKFVARALFDPENHERRERRMNERKEARNRNNFTYFFGDLTENEQQYRDYYESDVEETNEYEFLNQWKDEEYLRNSQDFDMKNYQFTDSSAVINEREQVEDFLGKSLFKYKYRRLSDNDYHERNDRAVKRSLERMQNNKIQLTEELSNILENYYVGTKLSIGRMMAESDQCRGLEPFLTYIAEEGFNQFIDYYENDVDEKQNMLYYKDLNAREKMRFAECFENHYNQENNLQGYYVSIPKRPYNNSKSIVANFFEDLIDFNTRVKPITRNLIFTDASSKYNFLNPNQDNSKPSIDERYRKVLNFSKVGKNFSDDIKH